MAKYAIACCQLATLAIGLVVGWHVGWSQCEDQPHPSVDVMLYLRNNDGSWLNWKGSKREIVWWSYSNRQVGGDEEDVIRFRRGRKLAHEPLIDLEDYAQKEIDGLENQNLELREKIAELNRRLQEYRDSIIDLRRRVQE